MGFMGKYVLGLLDGQGRITVYSDDSSNKLKKKRTQLTKSNKYLEVSRILKSSNRLPMMFNTIFKISEAMA